MEINSQNSLEKIEGLYKLVRVFLITCSTLTAVYLLNTLRASGEFAMMFATSGEEVPALSEFTFNHYPKLIYVTMGWQIVNIFILLKFKKLEWSYHFVGFSLIAMFFLEKVFSYANYAPLHQMMKNLL